MYLTRIGSCQARMYNWWVPSMKLGFYEISMLPAILACIKKGALYVIWLVSTEPYPKESTLTNLVTREKPKRAHWCLVLLTWRKHCGFKKLKELVNLTSTWFYGFAFPFNKLNTYNWGCFCLLTRHLSWLN